MARFRFYKWLWRKLPASFVINLVESMPHFILRYIGPVSVTIEPTTSCNLRCPLCPRTQLTRKHGSMDIEHFKHVIDGLPASVRIIELFFMGEPLLAPDIFKMIKYARSKGLYVRTSSNSTFLKQFTEKLLDSDLSELIVAIDGATEDVYLQYRINGKFKETIEGVKYFVQERNSKKLKNPKVVFQFIVMKHNEHELDAVYKLSKDLGVDHLVFKSASLMDPTRSDAALKDLREKYLPGMESKYLRGSYRGEKMPCRWSFTSQVLQDGGVTSCCYDWDGKHVIGNSFERPFKEIFRSKEYTEMRKKIVGQKLDICKNCDYNITVVKKIY